MKVGQERKLFEQIGQVAKRIQPVLLAASGDQMDVIMYSAAPDYAQRVGAGMLEPLDEYLKMDGLDPKAEFKIDTSVNGKYYALPGKMIEWLVLLNKDKLDQAKLPVPTD
ncbi:MAG: transporter substrate-binding protein [Paenibacillaceae bacterium]|nr:transporter substrate-binding protein [Paenibacillaceae bacterium]